MLGNETLWSVALRCHELLKNASLPHAVIGGVAVCLHGYQRNTIDVDLLVRRDETGEIRKVLESAGFVYSAEQVEFRSPEGIPVQLLMSEDRAGSGSEVRLPDPAEAATIAYVEGLPVVTLARLIESKLACGQGNLRRTHKDFADVVELIAHHKLGQSFARFLHKSLRTTYRELVKHSRGGE
jgi:hypothetical protein